ncbi:MAG: NAD(P)(+) transhydrogenase (Re/Si-specific) subunit beta [Nitriliruptorales bacterium]|nr:NAD(P)(+) transhydrogenase (Re/Si-specific) subunit beta [Nitriliruptorales bacterium]
MTQLAYLAAAVAFIVGIKRLGSPRTARSGNLVASVGMLLAVVVTLVAQDIVDWGVVGAGAAVGAAVGVLWARTVAMTDMPQMVAALNGLGGVASALVAGAELSTVSEPTALPFEAQGTILFSLAVGSLTFTGSLVAFGKLQGIVSGAPLVYRGQAVVNSTVTVAAGGLAVAALAFGNAPAFWALAGIALLIGVLMVLPIGGADMPVVVSLLNSLSGLAAAGTGFAIGNQALVIGGALVGSTGLILTVQMCDAMNRSLVNVLFGAFGSADEVAAGATSDQEVRRATPDDVAISMAYAERVVIIPGYGLAVAQAQHEVRKLAKELENRGVEVEYAIHPVAGRMPGHMNVLLAEADVPYEQLIDLDDANADLARTDVALVLGANDVVNPSARDDTTSPIFGMPIIEADRAKAVVVVKRSLSPGYAGVDNPLFYDDRTLMYFQDARKAIAEMTEALTLV